MSGPCEDSHQAAEGPCPTCGWPANREDDLLTQAISVLTAAARQTRTARQTIPDPAGGPPQLGEPYDVQADWAEFVTLALAGAAANIGSIGTILAGRPGSWEAAGVESLLLSTVGHDAHALWQHRTEPVVVDLDVDDLLVDHGGFWSAYDAAENEIGARLTALDNDPATRVEEGSADEARTWPGRNAEYERQVDALGVVEDRLSRQLDEDREAYAEALTAAVRAAAVDLGLRVPVDVRVHLQRRPDDEKTPGSAWWLLEHQLLEKAVQATPLPGDGRTPLQRVEDEPKK